MSVKPISLDLIRTDGGTQMRVELNQETYMDYRDKWIAGVEFDPVDLFHDGSVYWLADGFHRFYGAREAKRSSIPARIHQGTQRDAVLFSVGANTKHGLRRTNADKRMSVEVLLNDGEWVKWSDNKVAEQAGVSVPFVCSIRKALLTVNSSPAAKAADAPRVGRDGKERRPPRQAGPEREPGDDPVEPPAASTVAISDAFGPVADKLVPVFEEVSTFKGLQKKLGSFQNELEELQRHDAGAAIPIQEMLNHLKELKHALKFSIPYCECPKCRRSKKNCDTCEGIRWITEPTFKRSRTEDDEKWLKGDRS